MAGADALPLPTGNAGSLTTASNTLSRVTDRASQTHVVRDGGAAAYIAESWKGAASESREAEADRLRTRITAAVNRLPTIGSALTTYRETLESTVEQVEQWQRDWDDAEETYRGHLRRINAAPFPDDDRRLMADGYADERDAAHRRLVRLYDRAMEDLRAAGTRAATTIRGQCDLVVPADRAGSRLEIGAHLLRDLPLSGGEAMSELAEELAHGLAAALLAAETGEDPQALAALLDEYGRYADDPYFAHALMAELESKGLATAFNRLAAAGLRHGHDDELRAQQQEVMTMLGTLYATASGPADGDIDRHGYDYDEIRQWREDVWFPALTESGRAVQELADEGMSAGVYDGYWMQGQLLAAGAEAGTSPGPAYMRHVGQDMVAWDRSTGAARGARDWDFAAPFMRPDLLGYHSDSALPVLADDPVHALLHAAAQDEDSTYALLMSRIPGEDGRQPVVEYLVRERGGTMAWSQPFADQGALLAQTVAEHGTDRGDYQSTALAAHYLHAYTDTVADGTFANGTELSEHAFAGARTGTADVIVAHLDDFVRATTVPDGSDNLHGRGEEPGTRQIHFDRQTVNNFARMFGDLALDRPDEIVTASDRGAQDDPPALQRVLNAAVAHNALSLNESFADPKGDAVVAMDRGANFLIHLTESAGHGRLESAEAHDAYNEYLRQVVDSGAGMVPVGSIPLVGKPADAVYGLAADAILDHLIDTGHAEAQQTENFNVRQEIRALLQEQGKIALVEAGAWQDGKDPMTWAAENDLGPAESFVRDGELMPIEEILDGGPRQDAFFVRYLNAESGGAGALRELHDQVQQAIGAGTVGAETDYGAER